MKRNLIIAVCIGAVSGAAFASIIIWIWQILTGNISAIAFVATIIIAAVVFAFCQVQNIKSIREAIKANSFKLEKYQAYYKLFGSWMVLKNKGKMLSEYFEDHKFKNVAIYGLGRLGLCLYEELKSASINVKYAIDIDAEHFSYLDLKVISPNDQMEAVDVIIVTPFFEYQKIVDELRKNTSCKIISLEDVIFSL